jgi:hypothetical protein
MTTVTVEKEVQSPAAAWRYWRAVLLHTAYIPWLLAAPIQSVPAYTSVVKLQASRHRSGVTLHRVQSGMPHAPEHLLNASMSD